MIDSKEDEIAIERLSMRNSNKRHNQDSLVTARSTLDTSFIGEAHRSELDIFSDRNVRRFMNYTIFPTTTHHLALSKHNAIEKG
ncbi:hypothetical protein KIN20_014224 [Parelaphostrongylus tenuis]|uniref:Uncharacterized protein n=1 Tax=Parelaphostrongylus tenuis TaxID=148309 RepID=A0AAD5MYN5_PARTN|nr:hypothetical protein KIN20_014224 [Parelaphostrongylus tenuis]